MLINNYVDFVNALKKSGFTLAGSNDNGIFSLSNSFGERIKWHTEDSETDPWEWRMRVLNERNDIAYAKLFFKKNGYITKEWYPYFLAVRRGTKTLKEAYATGEIGRLEHSIYNVIERAQAIPTHLIKSELKITKEDKPKFDRALTSLQMSMYITVAGRQQKTAQTGDAYGWSSTVFCTTEKFWGNEVFNKVNHLSKEQAYQKISKKILLQNAFAQDRKLNKFIDPY